MRTATRDNRAIRSERSDVLKEARALTAKGNLTPAEQRQFDGLMREAEDLRVEYEALENRMMGEFRGGQPDGGGRQQTTRDKDHAEAFRSYLRFGKNEMPQEHRQFLDGNFRAALEARDMTTGGGNALQGIGGGYLVPVGFSDQIETALKFSGNLMKYCTIMPTETGAPLPWPTADDTQQQAEIIGESQQVSTQDVSLSNVIFGAYKYSSKMVKVSLELAQDSAFPIEDWLIGVLGTRFARKLNTDFTVGTGINQPKGLVTAALAAGNIVNAVGCAANTGSIEGANSIGSNDLFSLVHAVDPLYREDPSCRFMMHDQTRKALSQILDKYGRPLWPLSLVEGAPDHICGYPVALNNAMDQLQPAPSSPPVAKYTVAFGPMKKYLFRRVKDMSLLVLRERFADFGQIAYIAYMRADGNLLSAAQESAQCPIALLKNLA